MVSNMAKFVIGLGPLDDILGVPYYGNTLYQYIFFALIIILSIVFAKLFQTLVRKYISKVTAKTGFKLGDYATQVLDSPIAYFIVLFGIFIGLQYLTMEAEMLSTVYKILELLVGLGILWIIFRAFEAYMKYGLVPDKADKRFQMQLVPALSQFIKVIVFVIAVIILLGNLGFDVTALIAGFGVAGLAVGLAAKDILSDIFGGISIFSKRLFLIGDNITVLGLTGTVEEIEMRTTRIRAADGKSIAIPNTQVAANPVTVNVKGKASLKEEGAEERVQVSMDLSLVYGTSAAKITKAIKIIKDAINETKGCKKNPEVAFTEFKNSGLGISIVYGVDEPGNVMKAKHNVNMLIKKRFEDEEIKLSYPTSTVFLEKGESFSA